MQQMYLEMTKLWSLFAERADEPWNFAVDKLMVLVFLVTNTQFVN